MPTYDITGPDGKTFEVTAPDGASEAEVLAYAQKTFKLAAKPKVKPFGAQLNDFIADVPRQVGLTARYGLEGVGGVADFLATPFRGALNLLPGVDIKPGMGEAAANLTRLPQPRNAKERVVGDMSRMVASAALPLAAGASVAKNATGTTQAVGRMFAANPAQQMVSAGAAGGAGGYTRETGGDELSQLAASAGAGVAAPFAMGGVARGAQAASSMARSKPAVSPVQIDITINNALKDSGLNLGQLPAQVAQGIRSDVAAAYKTSGNLSADAVRRLADYRLTGTTPTAAKLTLDPAMVTQQENLAKLGANSKDGAAQALAQTKNSNSRTLTQGLNTLGASTSDDVISGGEKIIGGVKSYNDRADSILGRLYTKARASDGRAAALDPYHFTQTAGKLLNDANVESFLTSDIRNKLNQFASGDIPLNVDIAEQLKTSMGKIQRGTADGNVRTALGLVRQALDDTPLQPGQDIGKGALTAFTRARNLNRQYMATVEKTPALKAVRDGIEPDKFVQQFIVGGGGKANSMDVAMLKNSIKADPVAMTTVKEQITAHLKAKALSGNADEVGNFGQSGYNTALKAIGDRKLKLFFKQEEIDQLKAIGRVASYEQFQPTGSAVNNSNTASAGLSAVLDRIGGSSLLSKIPMGSMLQDPMKNIAVGMQAKRSLDVPSALTGGRARSALAMPARPRGLLLSPAALMHPGEPDYPRRE